MNGVRTTYVATTAGKVEHHETSLIDAARMEPAARLFSGWVGGPRLMRREDIDGGVGSGGVGSGPGV